MNRLSSAAPRVLALVAAFCLVSGAASAQPNWRAQPMFGTVTLEAGFTPDPHTVTVRAGGADRNPISGSGCAGHINNAQPDVDLNYTAGRSRLYIYVRSDSDTTLLVNDASGNWHCSDDFNGSNPAIILDNPPSGNYNIWVGTYDRNASGQRATVYISERAPRW
jgi:hypothetical protein